jgi:hypothetical protein
MLANVRLGISHGRRNREPAAATTWINDAVRILGKGPLDHWVDDSRRCKKRAHAAAICRGAQLAERRAKGISAFSDILFDSAGVSACDGLGSLCYGDLAPAERSTDLRRATNQREPDEFTDRGRAH